jgi:Ca-activated chloride channel family protein
MTPSLHIRPLRPAVAADGASTLDLLLTIQPPERSADDHSQSRPPLNLALVIDRSGSMAGSKLSYARKAARFLATELCDRDRLAIITFDSEVNVLVPSQPVRDPLRFISAINTIHAGGATALFDGWLAGATQVAHHLDPQGLNRVLLLSDGQANQGLTDQRRIARRVEGLTQRGISTSAFGLGRSFDEDLMGAIASAGDGTLAQIESPEQLADLYANELQGLAGTIGRRISLRIEPHHGAELVDVFNDLELLADGSRKLPNLRVGQSLSVGMRLQLPAWSPNQEIASFHLAWENPAAEGRQHLSQTLTLPVQADAHLQAMEPDAVVAEQLALLQANRQRRLAIEQLDEGDIDAAEETLRSASALFSVLPPSELTRREGQLLKERWALLRQDSNLSRKRLSSESLRSRLNIWSGGDQNA